MAQPTGAFDTFRAVGEREDLQDVIYNISPTETPFMSNIGQSSAKAVFHEWQTDSLATASNSNAQIEGDDVTGSTASATTRIGRVIADVKPFLIDLEFQRWKTGGKQVFNCAA